MAKPSAHKDSPISVRMSAGDITLIDRAASLRRRSRTDFVREAAIRAAEDVLLDQRLVQMSTEGFAAFMAQLEQRAEPVPLLVNVLRRPAPWDMPSNDKH